MATKEPKVLVVFDYDWSLVDANSDMFVFEQLHPPLLAHMNARLAHLRGATDFSWTALMDELLGDLSVHQPLLAAPASLRAALARIPVLARMLDAVRLAVDTHGAVLTIVSDANAVFIESMLEHHALADRVREVVTNPATFDADGRLRVKPHHALHLDPHGCADCPANMCKGQILDRLRRDHGAFTHVLYVGDGRGDFCPATRLTAHDIVFARADDADGKSYGLLNKIRANPARVCARVVPWSTGEDIFHHFQDFFEGLKVEAAAADAASAADITSDARYPQ